MDQLYKQKTIKEETLGIYFAPSAGALPTGELSFGAVDASKVVGAVHYVPVTSNAYAGKYWGIDQSISYGGEQILQESAGIVDTGESSLCERAWKPVLMARRDNAGPHQRRRVREVREGHGWRRRPGHGHAQDHRDAVRQAEEPGLQDRHADV